MKKKDNGTNNFNKAKWGEGAESFYSGKNKSIFPKLFKFRTT